MRKSLKKVLFVVGAALVTGVFVQFSIAKKDFSEIVIPAAKQLPPFLGDSTTWGDSVFSSFSLKEKIAQMMMVAVYPQKGQADKERVTKLIQENNIGGLIVFQGEVEEVADLLKYYQSISKVPLLIAIDGEWGASMRLDNTIKYPKQMMLGAITDEMLIYQMGKDIASQLKQIGIQINFAPVADINNNPGNPVINSRSFGEERVNVARKALLYMKGMQDEGVLAFAKHFPGHGDTKIDSHLAMPEITGSRERLDSMEFYPFRALINAGVTGVMVAHLHIPSLDTTPNLPATLSPIIIDSVLQKQMAFKGLVVTDAMGMGAITRHYKPIDANLKAIRAGNDILLMPEELGKSINAIEQAVKDGQISQQTIDLSCHKIIKAKEWLDKQENAEKFSVSTINSQRFLLNKKRLIEAAITVFENKTGLIPFERLDSLKIAHISLGPDKGDKFLESLKLYDNVNHLLLDRGLPFDKQLEQLDTLANFNLVIVGLHSSGLDAEKKFNVSDEDIALIDTILSKYPTVLVSFSNPYVLSRLNNLENAQACVEAYENDWVTQLVSAEVLFGALGASGKLPVSINSTYKAGAGERTHVLNRLGYVSPFEAGFDETKLEKVDSIIVQAIAEKAMPGCQILAARNSKVFLSKSYGYHTYWNRVPVQQDDLYDLASLTKISATLPSLMKLYTEKKINVSDPLKKYITNLDTTNKGDLIISDILLHQAGLVAWIPFYWSLLEPVYPTEDLMSTRYSETYPIKLGPSVYANKHIKYKEGYIAEEASDEYSFQIADHMFLRKDFADSIWIDIINSDIKNPGKYRYSDLGFYIFNRIIQDLTHTTLDNYTDSVFYKPLGAYTLCFNPRKKFPVSKIVPTENDLVFRKQIVHGYVHDPGSAMMGGVCGHAGLFGSANDLAKLMQMYLNNGRYGGTTFISRKTITKFTTCQACETGNRRGLGFDKPQPDTTLPGPSFKGISTNSYGHTGFTGTMTWEDPDTGILYIFLSNRVYPDAINHKLVSLNVRTNVQKAIYDAMLSPE
jgi:beta-N-acetylhexosaminidase